jgi:cellobiose phosphorylase
MFKFMLKCMALVSLLFFGVLLGMQQANVGLLQMKGYSDEQFQGVFTFGDDNASEQASSLGDSHNLKEKQEKLESMRAFNFFSSLGAKIAETASSTFQMMIHSLFDIVDKLLSSLAS